MAEIQLGRQKKKKKNGERQRYNWEGRRRRRMVNPRATAEDGEHEEVRRPPQKQQPEFDSCFNHRPFSPSRDSSDLSWYYSSCPASTPGVQGSALALVGMVSVYCDWVR